MWKTQMKLPASAEGRAHPGSGINYVNAEGQLLLLLLSWAQAQPEL